MNPEQPADAAPTSIETPVEDPATPPSEQVQEPTGQEPGQQAPTDSPELTDDEDWKPSWEADAEPDKPEIAEPPAETDTSPEKLTTDGLEEIKTYVNEQLKLDAPESERMWGSLLKLPRVRKSLEAFKTLRAVEQPWEEGGVGYMPGVEELRTLVQSKIAFQDLVGDLTSGDSERATTAWSFIFAPSKSDNGQPTLRPGIEQSLPHLPEILFRTGGPGLYNTVAKPILDNFINTLYDQGAKAEGKEKEWLLHTARGADWRINGTWRKDATSNGHAEPRSTSQPPQDPRVSAELEQLKQRNQTLENERLTSFRSSVEHDESAILNQGLDEALEAAKSIYPEHVYNAVRKDFAAQVSNSLKSNPVFQREYEHLLSRAQSGDTAARSELATKFRQQAGNSIKRLRSTFLKSIKSTTAERRTEADKDRAALAQVQDKVGPTSTGQPAQQQVSAPDMERPAGMSQRDWLQGRISQLTSAVVN
jgi:hypothetical protein